jgi:hypothetical protein
MTKRERVFLFCCAVLLMVSIAMRYARFSVAFANPVSIPVTPVGSPDLADIGIQLTDISTLSADQHAALKNTAIAQASAVARANGFSQIPPDQASRVEAKLYLFSDSHYGPIDDKGQVTPLYQNKLVWVVTYTGAVYSSGPVGAKRQINTEYNVVIDAVTGEYLEGFTYR